MSNKSFQSRLSRSHPVLFSVYAIMAAFCTYSCMYAFRKPYAVATFEGLTFLNTDYKIWLITAQVLGYTLSKFIGIKVISEMSGKNRAMALVLLIAMAGLALLGFALIRSPWQILFLFLNGLPLGMVWGLVFSYLEGRRTTELLSAGLSVSFIFSSGFVKSVGKYVMLNWQVSEFWMPFIAASLFFFPMLFFVRMLDQLPPPSSEDEKLRTKRIPMNGKARKQLFLNYAPGLILLIIVYMMLTAYRDFRDNFAAEIWQSLGYGKSSEIFTLTEIPISIVVLCMISALMLVKNNQMAFMLNHLIVLLGLMLSGIATLAFQSQIISPTIWIILVGMGLYLAYVPFNSIFFDRMISAFECKSNAGFLIYLADSFGYLGSIGVLFYKNFGQSDMSWLEFFVFSGYFVAFFGSVLTLLSMVYFRYKLKKREMAFREIVTV